MTFGRFLIASKNSKIRVKQVGNAHRTRNRELTNFQLPSASPTSPSNHRYSPTTAITPAFQTTYNLPHPTQYLVDQYSLYPSTPLTEQSQTLLPQPFSSNPFFDQPNTPYNPISGYQYHNYQDAGYFQQEMDYQSGYDASGDVVMPILEES
ncbi:hypothetical protein C8J55DRAFT_588021 [Lentinula edodes]|uniref:Uncharacterized protein n=1 Tax=Lentinula lateritia TaxID=40482 RepID=A0A9W9DE81_9AGAR|nr:hypothetical protein C8J55DRAFT_588021 [Lentinula edodes]